MGVLCDVFCVVVDMMFIPPITNLEIMTIGHELRARPSLK